MRRKLTDIEVKAIKPSDQGVVEAVDTDAPGLIIRVSATKKIWMVRYRPKGEAQRRIAIGHYPSMSLAQARIEAREYDRLARLGRDRKKEEEAGKEESARTERTLADVLNAYVPEHCQRNQKRWQQTERMFEQHILGTKLARKRVVDIRRADIIELLQDLLAKGLKAQVNRVHAQIKAALNWAVQREWLEANPAAAVKKQFAQEQPRQRVLSDNELRVLWQATDRLTDPSRAMIKLWILTGQRRDEVRCMRWEELDFTKRLWTLPPERNKAKRLHVIPLSPQVLAILNGLMRLGPYVFTATPKGDHPYAGQKRLKEILERKANTTGWPPWTFHDFRRTAATGMADLRVPMEVIARVLNHANNTITAVYNRHAYLEEKRDALDRWAARVEEVVSQPIPVEPVERPRRRARG